MRNGVDVLVSWFGLQQVFNRILRTEQFIVFLGKGLTKYICYYEN